MTLRIALTVLVVFLLIAALATFLIVVTRLLGRVAAALRAVGGTLSVAEEQLAGVEPAAGRVRRELDLAAHDMDRELPRRLRPRPGGG